jgi:hypothetical protein
MPFSLKGRELRVSLKIIQSIKNVSHKNCRLQRDGFIMVARAKVSLFATVFKSPPPAGLLPSPVALSSGINRSEWNSDQSPSSNVEVKNAWTLALFYLYFFHVGAGIAQSVRPRGRSSSPGRAKICLLSTSSRPALGPAQPIIQWIRSSRIRGYVHPLPHTPSWHSA